MAKHLRAVSPDEKPLVPRKVPDKIAEALDGSSRDVLAAMRKALARRLDNNEISSNSIASAYKELRELDRLIRAIDDEEAEEARRNGVGDRERRSFDSSAI